MKTGTLLSQVYKKTFWNTYDHIANVILSNLIWFMISPLPTFLWFRYMPFASSLQVFSTIVFGLLTNAYAASGIFGLSSRLASYEHASIKDFFSDARRFYWRTLALSLIYGALIGILLIGIHFYLNWKPLGGIPGFVLAGWQIIILALVLLMQTYAMPLASLRHQSVWRTIKWSAILTILRPGYTILVFLQATAIFVLVSITGVGLAMLALALVATFLNTATRELWRDIEAQSKPSRKPTSWREIFEDRQRGDEERRTLKDLLRPWDV